MRHFYKIPNYQFTYLLGLLTSVTPKLIKGHFYLAAKCAESILSNYTTQPNFSVFLSTILEASSKFICQVITWSTTCTYE